MSDRYGKRASFFGLTLAALLAGGCGAPVVRLSPAHLQAVTHNERGLKAEARGDHELAGEEFAEAARLYGAIDRTDGVIVALVNEARARRHAGEPGTARQLVDRALSLVAPASPLFGEVAFEKALVTLATGDRKEALSWAKKAAAAGPASREGERLNLVARIELAAGNREGARAAAGTALVRNRESGDRTEEANSLRLLGLVHTAAGEGNEAQKALSEALEIDRELGLSRKIAADLDALGDEAVATRDPAAALAYYRRAYDVRVSDRNIAAARALLEKMISVALRQGDHPLAERLRHELDRLGQGPAAE